MSKPFDEPFDGKLNSGGSCIERRYLTAKKHNFIIKNQLKVSKKVNNWTVCVLFN